MTIPHELAEKLVAETGDTAETVVAYAVAAGKSA